MIRFDDLETVALREFQGGRGTIQANIHSDGSNRIVRSTYAPGVSTGYHCHQDSVEIIFILSGECKVIHNERVERLRPGDCHYCKKGDFHAVSNDGNTDLVMYAVVCRQ